MRPGRRILLVGAFEDKLSVLAFAIRHRPKNRDHATDNVHIACSAVQAIELLRSQPRYNLILAIAPMPDIDDVLVCANEVDPTVARLVRCSKENQVPCFNTEKILYGDDRAELFSWIHTLTQCKRGPRKGFRKSVQPLAPVEKLEAVTA